MLKNVIFLEDYPHS